MYVTYDRKPAGGLGAVPRGARVLVVPPLDAVILSGPARGLSLLQARRRGVDLTGARIGWQPISRRGVGDLNPAFYQTTDGPVTLYNSVASAAQSNAALANLKAAGATSGSCQTYHVSYPGTPGYDETQCTSDLDNNYHDPALIAKMSPAQLAAEAAAARAAASQLQGGASSPNWLPNPMGDPISLSVPAVVKKTSPPLTGGSSAGSGGAGSTPPAGSGSSGSGQGAGGGGNPPPVSSISDFLSKTISIAGFDVPAWGVGAAVVGGFLMFGGKK